MSRVLVTGASAGLGLLTASSLARAGHEVILYARHRRRIEDADVLRRMWGVAYGDLGDLEEACRVAEEASLLGRLDSVVHNAGVLDGPDVLAVNVVAPFVLTALMAPPGRMIVLSSSNASVRVAASGCGGDRRSSIDQLQRQQALCHGVRDGDRATLA